MSSDQVHPLRIAKGAVPKSSSPTKGPRPLSELSITERRRNSPSWQQTSSTKKSTVVNDSSPFQSSPADGHSSSPRQFWQNRNTDSVPYGGGRTAGSPSPQRRSSIEKLQKASRVRNSNILALEQRQEYDPTRLPQIERPLAKVQVNSTIALSASSSTNSTLGPRSYDVEQPIQIPEFRRSGTASTTASSVLSTMSTNTVTESFVAPASASSRANRDQASSPTKSSLSPYKFKDAFDPVTGTWSAGSSYIDAESTGPSPRHVKSVTFDAAPPQVNEYELITPDPSSIDINSREGSYESDDIDGDRGYYDAAHDDNPDDSFDASLEDIIKTPVVGPDDYAAYGRNTGRFETSPMPESSMASALSGHQYNNKTTGSLSLSGEHRPLPPVPNRVIEEANTTDSAGLSATAERMLNSSSQQRNLPTPPPPTTDKSEIHNFGHSKMPLEERLKLMMLSDDGDAKSAAEQQRERRLRRGTARDRINSPVAEESNNDCPPPDAPQADDTIGEISALGDFQMPGKISRESIMRRVNGNRTTERPSDLNLSSPAQSPVRSPVRGSDLPVLSEDPDVPLPSTEDLIAEETAVVDDDDDSVIINRDAAEYHDDSFGMYDDDEEISVLPDDDTYHNSAEAVEEVEETKQVSAEPASPVEVTATTLPQFASVAEPLAPTTAPKPDSTVELQQEPREKALEPVNPPQRSTTPLQRSETHEKSYLREKSFLKPQYDVKPQYDGSGWGEEDEEYQDEPDSSGSVIHHAVEGEEDEDDDDDVFRRSIESPAIPERLATIKASNSNLKTRLSSTPSDLSSMREARRLASYEVPDVPKIPHKHMNPLSRDMTMLEADELEPFLERHPSFKNRSLTLDIDTGLSLDQAFERVIEGQKRGYLMRQNTKLIAASDKDGEEAFRARSANNSPVKNNRPESWTVEPWNGVMRQKSGSFRGLSSHTGPVPPLPGRESNSLATGSIAEEDMSMDNVASDGVERGRLFIKVMGVKDLDLPLPRNERMWFNLTLDNGVHCVTTSWLELARNAPIGQEFELVVPNDLEFQLTLNVKLEKPAYLNHPLPSKSSKSKKSAFSKVFASPKKRKEIELRQKEEARIAKSHEEALARQRNGTPSGYELLSKLVAEDGSFARSYVCLKEHESRCYGRPSMTEVVCFNEWAEEEECFASSVKSKRGPDAVVRRAPYKIGKLELQMLFVPRPRNVTDEDMPKSMNACVRELKATEERLARCWQGHLSQQGGDCPYWRRRYFKLVGTRLTAYHEATRQPRATINLANANRLIVDRRTLTERETVLKGGKRRKSGFSEEEEGYMFVEEGFRIRFNNGEVIDFYADTADDKDGWMKVLQEAIGRDAASFDDDGGVRSRAKWCDVVLKREEQLRRRAEGKSSHSRSRSAQSGVAF